MTTKIEEVFPLELTSDFNGFIVYEQIDNGERLRVIVHKCDPVFTSENLSDVYTKILYLMDELTKDKPKWDKNIPNVRQLIKNTIASNSRIAVGNTGFGDYIFYSDERLLRRLFRVIEIDAKYSLFMHPAAKALIERL